MKNGPLITDAQFFSSLSDDFPEIREAKKIYNNGDVKSAKRLFADFVKKTLAVQNVFSAYAIDPNAAPSREVMREADEALDYNLYSVGIYHRFEGGKVDWYSNPTENKYEEWTWQFARHYQLLSIALAYNYTKDEKYAERTFELIHSFIKQAVRPEPDTDGHATLCWRTLDVGIRLLYWGRILALTINSSSLTDDFLICYFKSVIESAERLMKKCTAANWLVTEMNGLYMSALLYPFIKDSEVWKSFAKDKLLAEIESQTLPDGTHCELTFGYQSVTCHDFLIVYRLGLCFGDRFPDEFIETIKKYLYTFAIVMAPDGTTPNLNDGYIENVPDFIGKQLDLFPDDEELLWISTHGKMGKKPHFLSHLFENAGLAVFRSNWKADAVYGIFDGGKYGKCHNHEDLIRCHQHEDKLSFLMWVGKRNPVCESMNYAYDTSKMRAYSRAAVGHNTILVGGLGQNRFIDNSWSDEFAKTREPVDFSVGEELDFASAVYDEGWGEDGARLAKHRRSVTMVKKPLCGKPFFIIKDEIDAPKDEELTLIWHYDAERLELTDSGCVTPDLTTFVTGEVSGKVYFGSEEPFCGWRSVSVKPPRFVPIPVVHFKTRDRLLYTVFVPNGETGECPLKSVLPSEGGVTVVYKDDRSQFFKA